MGPKGRYGRLIYIYYIYIYRQTDRQTDREHFEGVKRFASLAIMINFLVMYTELDDRYVNRDATPYVNRDDTPLPLQSTLGMCAYCVCIHQTNTDSSVG